MLRNKLNDFKHINALPSDLRVVEFLIEHESILDSTPQKLPQLFKEAYATKIFSHMPDHHWNVFLEAEVRDAESFLFNLFKMYGEFQGRTMDSSLRYVEKSPNNIYHLRKLKTFFPNSNVIYLVRDARDVVASLNSKWWAEHNTLSNAKRWKKEQHLMKGNYSAMVKYEDLASAPEEEMKKLLRVMEYPSIDEVDELRQKDMEKDPQQIKEPGQAIHAGNQKKYLKTLSRIDRELEIIQSICGPQLIELGYDLDEQQADLAFHRKRFFLSMEHYFNQLIRLLKGRNYH